MSERNKAAVRRFYDEVVGQGKLELIDELTREDFVEHEQLPGLSSDREGAKAFFAMFRAAFPDIAFNVHDMLADGDKVVARITMTGTHEGDFAGIAATGRKVSVSTIDILRLEDGLLVEHWGVTDELAMMQQLGVIPEG
jgi:steroid delta-isomerase-like uncharacterized protein